jgi:hypothetical protein
MRAKTIFFACGASLRQACYYHSNKEDTSTPPHLSSGHHPYIFSPLRRESHSNKKGMSTPPHPSTHKTYPMMYPDPSRQETNPNIFLPAARINFFFKAYFYPMKYPDPSRQKTNPRIFFYNTSTGFYMIKRSFKTTGHSLYNKSTDRATPTPRFSLNKIMQAMDPPERRNHQRGDGLGVEVEVESPGDHASSPY